jgi:signal transduction histidine kinase
MIKNLLITDYEIVEPYSGVNCVEDQVVENSFAVVMEDDKFLGILTPNGVVEHSHNLVIDCLGDKPPIQWDAEIEDVLNLMKAENYSVLPVFQKDEFLGVVTLDRITDYYLFEYRKELESKIQHLENNERLKEEIARRKQVEEKLKEINLAKDKFFSIVSHDLKNRFNTLHMSIYLLKNYHETLDKDSLKENINILDGEVRKVYKFMENLLEWSRLQRGKITCSSKKFDIKEVIEDNIHLHKESFKLKDIDLVNRIEAEVFVYADVNMINTVVVNLLDNALKFTPKGGGIDVAVRERETHVEVIIADTGVGIPQENIDKIFQFDKNMTTKGTDGEKGTGLGLSLCKEFVEKNGGEIWVESQEGEGSVFTVTLPKSDRD